MASSRFIKLEYGFLTDEKVLELTDEKGAFGLGVLVGFWQIQGESAETGYKVSRKRVGLCLPRFLREANSEVMDTVDLMIDIGLLIEDEEGIYSKRLKENLEEMDARIERLKKLNPSGKKTGYRNDTHKGTQEATQEGGQMATHKGTQEGATRVPITDPQGYPFSRESKSREYRDRKDISTTTPTTNSEDVWRAPTKKEVKDYCLEIGYPNWDYFYDVHSADGWKFNGGPMDDWRAVARMARSSWMRDKESSQDANGYRKPDPKNGMARDYTGQYDGDKPEVIYV